MTPNAGKRPNMRNYFAAQIDRHVNGMRATVKSVRPSDVVAVAGSVTSGEITVTMHNGDVWKWAGGHYAARKVKGCYAPLQPKPVS